MRREQIAIGGKQIGYLASEPAVSTPQRPSRTVVFLHAFPLTSEMWEPNLGALPEGWRGIAPDLRGFGRSSLPDPKSRMDDYAGDVVEIEARVKRLRSRMGQLSGYARVNGEVVLEGTMTFALGSRDV